MFDHVLRCLPTLLSRHRCFEAGLHTQEHTDLTGFSKEEAKEELASCIQRIQKELKVWPHRFSFCYGYTSESLRSLAAAAGIKGACGGEVLAPLSMRHFDLLTGAANAGISGRWGR